MSLMVLLCATAIFRSKKNSNPSADTSLTYVVVSDADSSAIVVFVWLWSVAQVLAFVFGGKESGKTVTGQLTSEHSYVVFLQVSNKNLTMGFGKAWKKKREKLAKSLNQAAKRANDLLDEAAGTGPHAKDTQEGAKQPSFLDKLNLAANNMQQAALQMQQYDYEVETSKDEATGQVTTTKVTMRDKKTGEIVSKHSQIQERDGTIRVTSTGKSSAIMMNNQGNLPPNFPKDCNIEYTMHKGPHDEYAVVECKVKDGPEAGKTLEYKVREGTGGDMTYVLVRESQSTRKMSVLVVLLGGALLAVAMSTSTLLNVLCMPVVPWVPLSSSERLYEAPWWVPLAAKAAVFEALCGDRPRASVTYESGQLSIRHVDEQKILQKKNGVKEAILSPGQVTVTLKGDKTVILDASWSI